MSLEGTIRALAEEGTVSALQEHLPKLLANAALPADPDRLYTYAQAAELMGVPESCIRERVRVGDLWVVQLGKYRRVPQRAITALIQRQELRATFRREQEPVSSDLDAEIDALLASPSVSAKKKARR